MTRTVTGAIRRRANRPVGWVAAAALAVWSPAAVAAPQSEADLFSEINAAVAREDYETAARLLDQAYARDPQPTYLYSLGEAWLSAGNCEAAVDAFDRYLATQPADIDADAARARRDKCSQAKPAPAAPDGHAAPSPTPVVVSPTSPPPPSPTKTLARDPLFWGLAGSGSVLVLTGAGVFIGAQLSADGANAATTEGTWENGVSQTRTLAAAGTVVVAVGGALLVGAIVRAVTFRRTSRARD